MGKLEENEVTANGHKVSIGGGWKYCEINSDMCITVKYAKNLLLYTLNCGGMNYVNKHLLWKQIKLTLYLLKVTMKMKILETINCLEYITVKYSVYF